MLENMTKITAVLSAALVLTVSVTAFTAKGPTSEARGTQEAALDTAVTEKGSVTKAPGYGIVLKPHNPGLSLLSPYKPQTESDELVPEPLPEDGETELPTAHEPIEPVEREDGGSITDGTAEGVPDGAPDTENVPDENIGDTEKEYGRILDVPYINQRAHFPNGCESVSTVMALQYLGADIDPDTFIEKYLDMGRSLYWKNGEATACDPREYFPGDPRNDSGWGCYPEVIKKAVDKMELEGLEAVVLKDTPLSSLCSEYIDNGIPVVFWGTIDMREPTSHVTWRIDDGSGRTHTWTSPFHCLLLVGYDSEYYYFNDPWRSKDRRYERDAVEKAYSGLGREALVILEM